MIQVMQNDSGKSRKPTINCFMTGRVPYPRYSCFSASAFINPELSPAGDYHKVIFSDTWINATKHTVSSLMSGPFPGRSCKFF